MIPASCPLFCGAERNLSRHRTTPHGFTLLEMVVVLALIAIIAGVALPNFARMVDSYEQKAAVGAVSSELSGLSFRAYSQAAPVILSTETSRTVIASLPADWQLTVDKPIIIKANGFCSGGDILLQAKDAAKNGGTNGTRNSGNLGSTWEIKLIPPLCAVALQ